MERMARGLTAYQTWLLEREIELRGAGGEIAEERARIEAEAQEAFAQYAQIGRIIRDEFMRVGNALNAPSETEWESEASQGQDFVQEAINGRDTQLSPDSGNVVEEPDLGLVRSTQSDLQEGQGTTNPPAAIQGPALTRARERLLRNDADSNGESTAYSDH